jgi:predicted metal-dependent hydrolase
MLKYFDGINDFVEAAQKTPSPPAELAPLSRQAIAALKAEAQVYFLEKTRYFGALMGVMPTEIKITEAKTRWGSCNVRNGRISICYSYRTMLLENDLREYVVIHELAHIGHMNHGRDFYERIKKFAPDYKEKTERINKAAKTLPRVD